jgi:hypothetical protein
MRWTTINWLVLVVGSFPFLLDSFYEAYVLTPLHGPQMLGFAVAHSFLGLIVWPSGLIYLLSLAYSAVLLLIPRQGKKIWSAQFKLWLTLYLSIGALHCGLLYSYDRWSPLFDRA